MATPAPGRLAARWTSLPDHRAWLRAEADRLFAFFERSSIDPAGGFHGLDEAGNPLHPGGDPAQQLHTTTRMVHAFSIACVMGRPGAATIVDHGLRFLWERHRDLERGGYFWSVGPEGPVDDSKQAYGHAFVLLAAASAAMAGSLEAERLLADVTDIILSRFWEEEHGAVTEEFGPDWTPLSAYRGQNANMHLTEALMAAFEATGRETYLRMAERIADLIIRRHAAGNSWRVPEHFDQSWSIDRAYDGNPIFRPFGTTPGHALEWSRLLVQLWELGGRRLDWAPGAARSLFTAATVEGWDGSRGGFVYTLGHDGRPRVPDRYWWPVCEGIGAAAALAAIDEEDRYEDWYRRIWDFAATHLIDRRHGGWHPQLGSDNRPTAAPFAGKPDIYHALQACLLPLVPVSAGLIAGLRSPAYRGA